MLLGTQDEEKKAKEREATRKVREMEKRLRRAGFGSLKELAQSTSSLVSGQKFDEGMLKP